MTGPNAFGTTAVLPPLRCSAPPSSRSASPLSITRTAKPGSSVVSPFSATRSSLKYGCRFRQDGGPEPSRSDQLANLLATSASAFDSFQRQIEAEPEMAVTFTVQIEVSPLQQYRQILGLLQLDDEHAFIDRVQNAGRHVDHVTRMHLDSVKHAEKSVDVLAHHQRLEVVAGYVLLQA
jgi:hypothetical protein